MAGLKIFLEMLVNETHLTPDLAKWSRKAQAAKGGTVVHKIPDISKHKKMCCDKYMGEKCDCKIANKGTE